MQMNKFGTEINPNSNTNEYSFGIQCNYWNTNNPYYVKTNYPNLEIKLQSNNIYKMSHYVFNANKEKAMQIFNSQYTKSIVYPSNNSEKTPNNTNTITHTTNNII